MRAYCCSLKSAFGIGNSNLASSSITHVFCVADPRLPPFPRAIYMKEYAATAEKAKTTILEVLASTDGWKDMTPGALPFSPLRKSFKCRF